MGVAVTQDSTFDRRKVGAHVTLARDPHAGDLYVFRGRRADLVKILWHDGLGMSLHAKSLERGGFVCPQAKEGVVALMPATLPMLLEGIDWRSPQRSWWPDMAG